MYNKLFLQHLKILIHFVLRDLPIISFIHLCSLYTFQNASPGNFILTAGTSLYKNKFQIL